MSPSNRLVAYARAWSVDVDEIRHTETSLIGFGRRRNEPVVLKIIKVENSEEWCSGEILEAFGGEGVIRPLMQAPGAVLLPRLIPGHDLASLAIDGRDDEATEILASLVGQWPVVSEAMGIGSVKRLHADFARFRDRAEGILSKSDVDRAETTFAELAATERDARLLHGDLHHFNVLFDGEAGWVVIDPWGAIGEIEFEIGPALRNPSSPLVHSPRTLERRLRIFENRLKLDATRALRWAFATTVLAVLWPMEDPASQALRGQFALAARAMAQVLG